MHACYRVATVTAGGVRPHFLRTTETGSSQKAKQRASTHAVAHVTACTRVHERSCMCRHDRHIINATMHAHAHAPCGPIPVAGVSTDTFSSGNDAARVRLVSLNIPARTNNYLSCSEHGWMGSQGCAQMRPNKRMPGKRGNHTMTKIEHAIMITVRMI